MAIKSSSNCLLVNCLRLVLCRENHRKTKIKLTINNKDMKLAGEEFNFSATQLKCLLIRYHLTSRPSHCVSNLNAFPIIDCNSVTGKHASPLVTVLGSQLPPQRNLVVAFTLSSESHLLVPKCCSEYSCTACLSSVHVPLNEFCELPT